MVHPEASSDRTEGPGIPPPSPPKGRGALPAGDEIESLLREAGRYQLEGYHGLDQQRISVKSDTGYGYSVVTEYDVETERRVHDFLEKRFPGDSFLGEELGNRKRDPRRYWILDPIDGTSNFTQGIPFWGPSLAFWDEAGVARGWIYFPALDHFYWAERGGGAFRNDVRLRTSAVTEYSNLATVATVSRLHRRSQLTCPAKHRILGSIVANFAYLAAGTFAAMFCRGSVWDLAAGFLVAREAGAILESDPPLEKIDLSSLDPKSPQGVPSITVYGMANASLPSLHHFIRPLEKPIEGR